MREGGWWRARGLLTIGALALVAFVAVACLFVLTPWGQRLDHAAYAFGSAQRWPARLGVGTWRSHVAIPVSLAVMLGSGAWLLLRRRWRAALVAFAVALGTNVAIQVVKELLPRPEHGYPPDPNTLPSGHVGFVGSAAVALTLAAPPRVRPAASLVGLGMTALMAWASLLGPHRPSDCVAAVLLLGVFGSAGLAVLRLVPREDDDGARRSRSSLAPRGSPPTPRAEVRLASSSSVLFAVSAVLAGLAVVGSVLVATGMTEIFRGLTELVAGAAGLQATLAAVGVLFGVVDRGSRPLAD